jgi:pimeloyl-ACP methyl ester carboxylesterase
MKTKLLLVAVLSMLAVGCGGSDTPSDDGTQEEEVAMEESPVEGVTFRNIETNGINMRIAEAGNEDGAVVLLVHGWPESWYSWRHQITALADAGYRVVVPEMRGYGKTDAPEDVESYDIKSLSADMAGVLDAVGAEKATIIGHDWGAIVAANALLFHPDRFSSLVLMSVPYGGRPQESLMTSWNAQYGDNFYYILYHNEEGGVAEAEYDSDPRGFLSRLYLSPDSPREAPTVTDPLRAAGGWIPRLGAAKGLPSWLTQDELDYFVAQFEASGFRGGINYYRNFHRNWEITEHLATAKIEVPTLFVAGQKDMVIGGATAPMLKGLMGRVIPDLRDVVIVPEMGHWIQQEAPKETNEAVLGFLQGL